MTEEKDRKDTENPDRIEPVQETSDDSGETTDEIRELKTSLEEANNKYVRLYADFENFKKISARNREELLKYANEDLLTDILTVIDHLELALHHSTGNDSSDSLAEGVELTLKEMKTVLEKYGLTTIDALGKPFNPAIHHAISQIESDDADENTVVKEFRKGYMLKDRVIRASMVGVAIKRPRSDTSDTANPENATLKTEDN